MHNDRDEFDRMMNKEFAPDSPGETIDHTPYGPPVQYQKTGLTKRGKAALGIGATVLAGSAIVGYQIHSANVAESEAKAKELTIQSQALELEKIRELNRAGESDRKATASYDEQRQKLIDKCVETQLNKVDKGFGSSAYRGVVDGCQDQYAPTTSTDVDMETAGSVNDGDDSSGGINQGALIGVGAIALFVVGYAKRNTRSNPA